MCKTHSCGHAHIPDANASSTQCPLHLAQMLRHESVTGTSPVQARDFATEHSHCTASSVVVPISLRQPFKTDVTPTVRLKIYNDYAFSRGSPKVRRTIVTEA